MVEAETEAMVHRQAVIMTIATKTALMMIVEDGAVDQVVLDAEVILRRMIVMGLMTENPQKTERRQELDISASNCRSSMEQDLGNPGGRILKIVLLTINGLNVISWLSSKEL